MTHFFKLVRKLKSDRRGATAVEYAMIVGLVAIASLATLTTLGENVNTMFTQLSTALAPAK